MSRRPMQRTASSEAVFAQRRGEIPYQIYFEISNIGRNVESSKKRARWMFCFGDEGQEHEVTLVHSVMSGKKKTLFNGELINEAQKVATEWSFAWSFGAHLLRVGINFDEYSLVVDGIPFSSFSRRDPYLAAQLEATKRDSMRSLKTDEQRRFEKLGYDSGGGGRSRTTERRRPSGGSTGSRRDSSKESALRPRSDSEDRRAGDRARPTPMMRTSSAKQFKQSPPSPSGPGEQRERSKTRRPRGLSNGRSDGHSGSNRGASGGKSASGDILSADPSSLEVNPFNAQVSEADFDPLASRQGTARELENGNGNQMGGARGGGGDGFAGTGQQDADAVLRLGMQFKTMEVRQQFQQQPPPQQQQQYESPFDHTAYQQYDDSGFPQPMQQQAYTAPPPQVAERVVFGRAVQAAPQSFGGPSGDAGFNFPGGYHAHGQQEQQQQQQQQIAGGHRMPGQRSASSDAADGKASLDPWELARSGMVNIDDITDTKHLPPVEVKPFTNDHRPLADLVRETPSKPRVSVMMERPEPAPTHMAVAIVPVQPPRQQQNVLAQGGYPQQQNGNPFARLALTQYGQPAQPILYTKPDDPFHNL